MNQRGFTLIEVLIAVMILAGAMIVLASSWGGSMAAFRKSQNLSTVTFLLKRKMAEIELQYKDSSAEEVKESDAGDFGTDFPEYRWEMESKKMEFPDLSSLLISRDEGADETLLTMVKQMTDQFNKAIKEIKVTVFWKVNDKEQAFPLTTYFVDYNQGVNLGGAAGAASGGGGK